MNFPLYYFQHKKGWYSVCVFSYVYGVWICDKKWMNFEVYFSYVYGVWICDKKWMNFKVYFSYVYRVRISGKEWMNFKVYFSYVYRVLISDKEWMNFKICFHLFLFMGYESLMKNRWISRYAFSSVYRVWISDV